jgi:hypothetical protein
MAKQKVEHCFIKISGDAQNTSLETENLFRDFPETQHSPIDIYIARNKSLMTKLGEFERASLLDIESEDDRHIYNLFLLGFISNVESYFRSIIREIIIIDPCAYEKCLEAQVTYAAAMHHNEKLLPEAILEQCTFISKSNINSSLNSFTGINTNKQDINSVETNKNLELFEQLCQLRHCIVHRAGLLGSKNAIKLGIDTHKNFFEKPITLNTSFLQSSSLICLNSVKTTNNLLFNSLVNRFVTECNDKVTWDFRTDGKWFKPYFKLFSSNALNLEMTNQGETPLSCFEAYDRYREAINS